MREPQLVERCPGEGRDAVSIADRERVRAPCEPLADAMRRRAGRDQHRLVEAHGGGDRCCGRCDGRQAVGERRGIGRGGDQRDLRLRQRAGEPDRRDHRGRAAADHDDAAQRFAGVHAAAFR